MEAFIREFGIAHHQLQSFNDFVERDIATLEDVIIDPVPLNISGEGKTLHFRFGQVSFKPPVLVDDDNRVTKMYPSLARLRGETYGVGLHVDIHVFTMSSPDIPLTQAIVQIGTNRAATDATEPTEIAPNVIHRLLAALFCLFRGGLY